MSRSRRILHLSDTHLFGDDTRHYGVVDTAEALTRLLGRLRDVGPLDVVVCSGDVSEDGSEDSYARVRALLEPWAAARGARTVYAMGNHDRREAFRAVIGDGQPGVTTRVPAGEGAARAVVSSAERDGLRTIVLDSSVPGRGVGELDEAQRAFLREELSVPAEAGTVVVLHHPPVAARTRLLQALALREPGSFFEALRGGDVRVVLSGHYHLPLFEIAGGVPVVVAPGVTNLARAFDDPEEESAIRGSGAVLVELGEDGGVRAVPFVAAPEEDEVFRFDAETVGRIVAAAG